MRRVQLRRPGSAAVVPAVTLTPRAWNRGPVVLWTHPAGQASVFGPDGVTAVPAAQWLLTRGVMVIAPEVMRRGRFRV